MNNYDELIDDYKPLTYEEKLMDRLDYFNEEQDTITDLINQL